MTRISYEQDYPGAMRAALRRALNHELRDLYRAHGIDRHEVYEAMIVANSTMRDLFFGLDIAPIGESPYRVHHRAARCAAGETPTTWLRRRGHEVGLLMHPHGRVVGAPLIASHVGGGHRGGPRRGRFRGGQRHPDAGGHRHEHRGRGHRRHALPRRLLSGRSGLRGRPGALRDARRRRRHRDRSASTATRSRTTTIGDVAPDGHLRLRPRRHPGRAPARATG